MALEHVGHGCPDDPTWDPELRAPRPHRQCATQGCQRTTERPSDPSVWAYCPTCTSGLFSRRKDQPVCHSLDNQHLQPEPERCRTCGHEADHIDRRDGCDECNAAAQLGQHAPCCAPALEYLEALGEPSKYR